MAAQNVNFERRPNPVTARRAGILLLVTGCIAWPWNCTKTQPRQSETAPAPISEMRKGQPASGDSLALLKTAAEVRAAFVNGDFVSLQRHVHPQRGLTFWLLLEPAGVTVPYDEIPNLARNDSVCFWGNEDGTGKPIRRSVRDWVADVAHALKFATEVAVDRFLRTGSTPNRLPPPFEGQHFVDFTYPGYESQKERKRYWRYLWRSERLVFVREGGRWLLVGINTFRWTI